MNYYHSPMFFVENKAFTTELFKTNKINFWTPKLPSKRN